MSRNTPGRIRDYDFWCLDNSIQIAIAHLVEILREKCQSKELAAVLESWAVHAGVNDLHFDIPDDWAEDTYAELQRALQEAIRRAQDHGDYTVEDVAGWYIWTTWW